MIDRLGDEHGRLDQRIQIYERITTQNALNEEETTLALLMERWAEVSYISGDELSLSRRETSYRSLEFRVRYSATLEDKTLLVRYRSQDYDIEAVEDIAGQREYMLLRVQRYG